jgi:hypothetical protein
MMDPKQSGTRTVGGCCAAFCSEDSELLAVSDWGGVGTLGTWCPALEDAISSLFKVVWSFMLYMCAAGSLNGPLREEIDRWLYQSFPGQQSWDVILYRRVSGCRHR